MLVVRDVVKFFEYRRRRKQYVDLKLKEKLIFSLFFCYSILTKLA
jgi:hypothetical protein